MRAFWTCWRLRGVIAASVYGDIDETDSKRLEQHLATCNACRKQITQFQRVAGSVHHSVPPLELDLVPLLQQRLRGEITPKRQPVPLFRFHSSTLAAAAMLVITIALILFFQLHASLTPTFVANNTNLSPMQQALQTANQLTHNHEYAKAYQALKDAVDRYPNDQKAGQAQRERAEIAYAKLHWYPEAYADYELLATRYYDQTFKNAPECIQRREILTEAKAQDFASIKALDVALQAHSDTFAALENVIGQYPATYVASIAAQQLASVTVQSGTEALSPQNRLASMEQARDRCKNPVVVAQLNVELGHIYANELNDIAKARTLYSAAKQSGNNTLARLAENSLQALSKIKAP